MLAIIDSKQKFTIDFPEQIIDQGMEFDKMQENYNQMEKRKWRQYQKTRSKIQPSCKELNH